MRCREVVSYREKLREEIRLLEKEKAMKAVIGGKKTWCQGEIDDMNEENNGIEIGNVDIRQDRGWRQKD